MTLEFDKDLQAYNTFGVAATAFAWIEIQTLDQLKEALIWAQNQEKEVLLLGGGSNMLLVSEYIDKVVISIQITGISTEMIDDNTIEVTANAGENWHEFVQYCLQNNWGGIENLSLIPGNVGTAPIQNIGAYGVELQDVLHSVEVLDRSTLHIIKLSNNDCKFGYRDSIFKSSHKNQYIITSVAFHLTTHHHHIKTHYGAIEQELEQKGILQPTIKEVSEAVIAIRESKLPNPKLIGNGGSFFKNPIISRSSFLPLIKNHPTIPHYELEDGMIKIPAGWLIEQAGWKGKRVGNCGVHDKQALVLVNYGMATGQEIYDLSDRIIVDIQNQFQLTLEREVNMIK